MTLVALLMAVMDTGGRFLLDDAGGLIYRGPRSAMTDELRTAVAAHKPALLAVAAAADHARPPPTIPDGINGDDWRECEVAISAARGWLKDAAWVAETCVCPERRRAVLGYLNRIGEVGG